MDPEIRAMKVIVDALKPLTEVEQARVLQWMVERYDIALPKPEMNGRQRVMSNDHLRRVAEVYRAAMRAGKVPTQEVADHFGKSHSTAARWVMQARREGFLGAAKPGAAGEFEDVK